jgi:hypothetical protein
LALRARGPERKVEASATAAAARATAFEVSRLPPIESITADSSVAAFLEPGVPEDLARAALRSAWASDPAIREFIGIADNQWDFNAEGTIAGFGSLSPEELTRYVAARTLGSEHMAATNEAEDPADVTSGAASPGTAADDTVSPAVTSRPSADHRSLESPGMTRERPVAAAKLSAAEGAPGAKRSHGGALPK